VGIAKSRAANDEPCSQPSVICPTFMFGAPTYSPRASAPCIVWINMRSLSSGAVLPQDFRYRADTIDSILRFFSFYAALDGFVH
jgi:hypothetical protein